MEEARLRAQREAESYAYTRRDRDGVKREVSHVGVVSQPVPLSATPVATGPERRSKRSRGDVQTNGHVDAGDDPRLGGPGPGASLGDDSEAEKQERYQRRLDMNRESAAVSRVRRRAYVKELEERLAAVEAEKLQLEGKLEIMQSQNDSFKKQLDNLFMMVAGGRRPPLGAGMSSPPPPGTAPGPGSVNHLHPGGPHHVAPLHSLGAVVSGHETGGGPGLMHAGSAGSGQGAGGGRSDEGQVQSSSGSGSQGQSGVSGGQGGSERGRGAGSGAGQGGSGQGQGPIAGQDQGGDGQQRQAGARAGQGPGSSR